jgi:hypothetical protein
MHFTNRLKTFPYGLWWAGCLSFVATCTLGAVLLFNTRVKCDALSHYSFITIGDVMRRLFMLVVYVPVMLWLGIRTYRWLRERMHTLNSIRGTASYFILLAFVIFPFQFIGIGRNILDGDIRRSICAKSTSDGSFTESHGLTVDEYSHLQNRLPILPILPSEPIEVSVNYYSDGFLPDFSLTVGCAISRSSASGYRIAVPITEVGPSGWMLDTTRTDETVAWLIFNDGVS